MYVLNIIRGAVDFQADLAGEDDSVDNIVVVPVDLNGSRVRRCPEGHEIVIEIRLSQPRAIDHDLMTGIDLDAKIRKVQEISSRSDRRTHYVVDLNATVGSIRTVHEEVRKINVHIATSLRILARALLADDEDKVVLGEIVRCSETAVTKLHVRDERRYRQRLADEVFAAFQVDETASRVADGRHSFGVETGKVSDGRHDTSIHTLVNCLLQGLPRVPLSVRIGTVRNGRYAWRGRRRFLAISGGAKDRGRDS